MPVVYVTPHPKLGNDRTTHYKCSVCGDWHRRVYAIESESIAESEGSRRAPAYFETLTPGAIAVPQEDLSLAWHDDRGHFAKMLSDFEKRFAARRPTP